MHIKGTGDADSIIGGEGDDVISGKGGGDTLDGGGGSDTLNGGAGDDYLIASGGADRLDGGAGRDVVSFRQATSGVVVDLGDRHAQDTGLGQVTLASVEGVEGSAFADTLTGGKAADQFDGGRGADLVRGGGGDDTIWGGDGADSLLGGSGDDTFHVPTFPDHAVLAGGSGVDTLIIDTANDCKVDLAITGMQEVTEGGALKLSGIEDVTTGYGDDVIYGDDAANRLDGADGDNSLHGRGGDDILVASVYGWTNYFDGGDGFDTAEFDYASGGVTLTLAGGFISIEQVVGTVFDDRISVGGTVIAVNGRDGDDQLTGGAEADTLIGGGGDDRLVSGAGADRLLGGDGIDTADFSAAASAVRVDLGIAGVQDTHGAGKDVVDSIEVLVGSGWADTLTGAAAGETLAGGGADDLVTSGGGDRLEGGEGNDTLIAGKGDDTLDGGAGTDIADYSLATHAVIIDLADQIQELGDLGRHVLIDIEGVTGSAYADSLSGSDGDDVLHGGRGDDTLSGGHGTDHYVFLRGDGHDVVSDFSATDVLVLDDYDSYRSLSQTADGTLVSFAKGDSILLEGVDAASLTAGNFDFAGPPDGDDLIVGTAAADTLEGGLGDDTLMGLGGDDSLDGGDGDDLLVGGLGFNTIRGGDGVDTLDYSAAWMVSGSLHVQAFTGYVDGGTTRFGDVLVVGVENIIGSAGGDTLEGDNGDNVLTGGRGGDWLKGLGGADTFVYHAVQDSNRAGEYDSLVDFSASGGDRIDVSDIDADTGAAGDQAFHIVSAFTGAGQAVIEQVGDGVYRLLLNIDDDLAADATINIYGDVSKAAFIL